LTCENTNTLIPYIDLALEVMESYVVHAPMITAHNVNGETSNELLCAPQHTNLAAYEILRTAIYPLGLPYHFPIDTMRVFLQFLKTSRADIIRIFQPAGVLDPTVAPTTPEASTVLRSYDAELNLLTQEEYVILTKEAFSPTTKSGKACHHPDYAKKIGLRDPWEYFGYETKAAMLDDHPTTMAGLSWVKAQFLPRTGILYTDLVDLVQTRFINPAVPTGKALATMEKIRFSCRFLQYLVCHKYRDKRRRYARLIQFLELSDVLVPLLEDVLKNNAGEEDGGTAPDLCADPNSVDCEDSGQSGPVPSGGCGCSKPPPGSKCCCGRDEWTRWVYDWFEKIGCIVVLESGEGPQIPLQGRVWAEYIDQALVTEHAAKTLEGTVAGNSSNITSTSDAVTPATGSSAGSPNKPKNTFVGTLKNDGALVDDKQDAVAFVTKSGTLTNLKGKNLADVWSNYTINVYAQDADVGNSDLYVGYVGGEDNSLYYSVSVGRRRIFRPVKWSEARDDCDISKTRLLHLDGSQLSADEYFSIARFLRLWRKLGWTMTEVDEALIGLGKTTNSTPAPPAPPGNTGDDDDSCSDQDDEDDEDAEGSSAKSKAAINPQLIHQLVSVRQLFNLTGLPLQVVLTFWDLLPTHGGKSLYASTFLTHNIVRMDPVFQADVNGNYFTTAQKISDHLPVLQATLRLKASDITLICQLRSIPDALNMKTLSELYRVSTLIRCLSVRADLLPDILAVLGEPFTNADVTLTFIQTWQLIINSNFSFQQLNYLIRGVDNLSRPLAPTAQAVLKLGKTLLDGLASIAQQNADVTQAEVDNKKVSLADFIPAELALVFDSSLAGKINDLVNGRTVYTTNAPSRLGIVVPPAMVSLAAKAKYNDQPTAKPPTAQLVVTGILTDEEAADLKGLSSNTLWGSAVDRVKKQAVTFYKQFLQSIFPADGPRTLLAGDTPDTPASKGMYFLQYFMPYLRARLSTAMVQQTMSDTLGIEPTTTAYLLNIVKSSSGVSALDVLLALQNSSQTTNGGSWSGYLIPPSSNTFQFWVTSDTKPPDFMLDGVPYGFPHHSEDPTNIWSSDPIALTGGRLSVLRLSGFIPDLLSWSTSTSPPSAIPSSAVLPDVASSSVSDVLVGLTKISILIQGFNLTLDEVTYFHDHGSDFASLADKTPLDVGKVSLGSWKRLQAYAGLRDSLPKQPTRLIDLFAWSYLQGSTDVVGKIVQVTRWDANMCTAILTGYNAMDASHFHDERTLLSLKAALDVATKTAISVPLLIDWAKPLVLSNSAYKKLSAQAEMLKKTLKGRYNATDWEQAGKSLFDTLRKNQRDALVAYLVVQPSLVATGLVKDADGLFEYFLIDCQMSSCLQTSRIEQAIATIQLYVQRCLLGLEVEVAQQQDDFLDRKRWDWMKRYRVWEANRQVYLYPENWIDPSLRDDKTPFFLDLESALQQKDISMKSAAESLKTYVHNVAAVANLKVYGLFVQKSTAANATTFGVHIVARRMNAPFDWYSRDYSADGIWSPWVKMAVDIPNYDVDDVFGKPIASGSYVAPFLWQGRPIIFFMQMTLKQITADNASTLDDRMKQDGKAQNQNIPVWQINMGASRFDNGKWTPKELSQSSLRHVADEIDITDFDTALPTYPIPNQARYQMVPRFIPGGNNGSDHIQVDIVYTADETVKYLSQVKDKDGKITTVSKSSEKSFNEIIGSFTFIDGAIAQQLNIGGAPTISFNQTTAFSYLESTNTIYSFQIDDGTAASPQYFQSGPSVQYPTDPTSGSKSTFVAGSGSSSTFVFNHTFVDALLKQINTSDDINVIYDDFHTLSQAADSAADNPFGDATSSRGSSSYNEQMSPNGIYNWEMGLHAPMTLINALLKAQQFDGALAVCHTIFDPTVVASSSSTSGDNSVFWKFAPFKALANSDAKESLETIFLGLKPGASDAAISAWRDNPFAPHVVARMRPVAYMKWVAMKYIEILIAYGDYYFRQNSRETILDAIQCYVLASHVYGPRGQKIPRRGKIKPETYSSLLGKWDAFGNAVVQLEVEFPFSNQTNRIIGSSNGITGLANIYGFASSLYFCIPSNPQLASLRETIDDRLFKIRNCMDINGVVRQPPLFDPPIDPGLLVAATAQGLSIDTVLNDLSGPVPNYRFQTLIAKAIEICQELKGLGTALLSAKEKKDAEHMASLRATHDRVVANFTLDMKNRALDEANAILDQLTQNREGPKYRLQFFKSLIGQTDAAPGETDEFSEIPNTSVVAPISNGQMLLIPEEDQEVSKAGSARDRSIAIGGVEALAGILHTWPDLDAEVKPFGIGTGLKWGGSFYGGSTGAVARGMQIAASTLSADSANAGRKAALLRALQDRVFQANNAGKELKNVDAQIAAQRIRVSTGTQDIANSQTVLDNATAVEDFLKNKYTNEELYSWLEGRTRALYNDTYNLAYDLAKRAEKAFQFEWPRMATSSYIEFGYFTSVRDGLLAGEALYTGLKRLEGAWQADVGHDFEVTKHISVRQWAPLALLEFRETGSFVLDVPEILFDMDCPGHYMRRISSINVSIPCVAGPYAGINCTLRLASHTTRTSSRATGKADYPRVPADQGDDDRFMTNDLPITAVVLSSAQADSGRFDNPADRYNAFEGAGAISSWSFGLPTAMHSFDYLSITDVVLTIRYTSLDGGDSLRGVVDGVVGDYLKAVLDAGAPDGQGLFAYFDLKADFASEWYRSGLGTAGLMTDATMTLESVSARLPLYTARTPPAKIVATRVAILAQTGSGGSFSSGDVTLTQIMANTSQTGTSVSFKPGVDIPPLTGIVSADDGLTLPMTSWTLSVKNASAAAVGGLWMVVRYSLT
jgi:hypothetical protein